MDRPKAKVLTISRDVTRTSWLEDRDYRLGLGSNQCRGCGSLLAAKLVLRTMYEADSGVMVWGRSCGGGTAEMMTGGRIASDGSGTLGIQEAMKFRGITDRKIVVMTGEGRTLDMGGRDFEAAFERGQEVTYVILDNHAYAMSGGHATPMTPKGAATHIYTHGKTYSEKFVPLMMLFSGARYVATVNAAYVRDLQSKVLKALETRPSYLHVFTPCIAGWQCEPKDSVKVARLAVETGAFPLWEFENGVMRKTDNVVRRQPVRRYLELQPRFGLMSESDILDTQESVNKANSIIDKLVRGFGEE